MRSSLCFGSDTSGEKSMRWPRSWVCVASLTSAMSAAAVVLGLFVLPGAHAPSLPLPWSGMDPTTYVHPNPKMKEMKEAPIPPLLADGASMPPATAIRSNNSLTKAAPCSPFCSFCHDGTADPVAVVVTSNFTMEKRRVSAARGSMILCAPATWGATGTWAARDLSARTRCRSMTKRLIVRSREDMVLRSTTAR